MFYNVHMKIKHLLTPAVFFILLIFLILAVSQPNSLKAPSPEPIPQPQPAPTPPVPIPPYVSVNGLVIPVEVEQTEAQVKKGLSGRASLDAEKGMLFVFSKPDIYHFWMPNMHFSIDIIWINNGQVVDITPNLPYDAAHAAILYEPSKPVKYVLEMNADFAAKHGIIKGAAVSVKI